MPQTNVYHVEYIHNITLVLNINAVYGFHTLLYISLTYSHMDQCPSLRYIVWVCYSFIPLKASSKSSRFPEINIMIKNRFTIMYLKLGEK